jgi:hypothetical protein
LAIQISGEGKEIKQLDDVKTGHVKLERLESGLRFERKFFVPPKNVGLAYMLLKQICRPEMPYPEGRVTSLYFDTPDLDQYFQSASGDFKKYKVRIRWYNSVVNSQDRQPVFLELKKREGFTCNKHRQKFLVPSRWLERSEMGTGIISRAVLMETLAGFGNYPKSPLQPVIVISYRRYRFTEMLTGMRICFDQHINSYVVSPGLGYGKPELQLEGGVIEVKGANLELPVALRRINTLATDWTRFSKYGNCLESHLETAGSGGQLWPSGRTNIR